MIAKNACTSQLRKKELEMRVELKERERKFAEN